MGKIRKKVYDKFRNDMKCNNIAKAHIICFECSSGREPEMIQTNYDPETKTYRLECPKCDNIILIQM